MRTHQLKSHGKAQQIKTLSGFKKCTTCHQEKDESEFYANGNRCKACRIEYQLKRYGQHRRELIDYQIKLERAQKSKLQPGQREFPILILNGDDFRKEIEREQLQAEARIERILVSAILK